VGVATTETVRVDPILACFARQDEDVATTRVMCDHCRKGDQAEPFVPNENARALRKRLTPQEVKLWVKLREMKGLGFHFRRQAPGGPYVVDFISFRSRLVIEADGGQHGMPEGVRSDRVRDSFLHAQGFRIFRFWNSEIDQNIAGVLEIILGTLNAGTPAGVYSGASAVAPPPDQPSAGHPPHKGEG
jgi:very-short-patch-repair endonuclease